VIGRLLGGSHSLFQEMPAIGDSVQVAVNRGILAETSSQLRATAAAGDEGHRADGAAE
jgi:hypothetical protein